MVNNIEEKFIHNLLSFNIQLSEMQLMQFQTYYKMLIEWNEKINLTAITDYEEVLTKHFLDSLSIARVLKEKENISGMVCRDACFIIRVPVYNTCRQVYRSRFKNLFLL